MITWETIVGIATFGGFLFGFYWLLRTEMREMSRRFDQKFDAVNVKFDAVNAKLTDVSERLAVVEERTRNN